jgi:hypothetical protein
MAKLLYDRRFTAGQFILAPGPLRPTTRYFFPQLNSCGNSPYVTSSLTGRWVCLLWICLVFGLHTSSLSVQSLQNRSCLYYVSYVTTAALIFSLAYNISARTTSIVAFVSVAAGTCLLSRCPETVLEYLPISLSLHSNGSTRCNVLLCIYRKRYIKGSFRISWSVRKVTDLVQDIFWKTDYYSAT